MEFRWLTSDERRTGAVESHSLSEVLALAQKLQAEGDGLVSEDQVVDMGREPRAEPPRDVLDERGVGQDQPIP